MGGNGDGPGPSLDGTPGTDAWGSWYYNHTVRNNYLNIWNSSSSYSGCCDAVGTLYGQNITAAFWLQSYNAERGCYSEFNSYGYIRPQGYFDKFYGFTLRCVKDSL